MIVPEIELSTQASVISFLNDSRQVKMTYVCKIPYCKIYMYNSYILISRCTKIFFLD